jgi:hypothetical protein
MVPDPTGRLLQILRTTLALIKYYEGHPATAGSMMELKRGMQRAIDDLARLEAAEKSRERDDAGNSMPDMDLSRLDRE